MEFGQLPVGALGEVSGSEHFGSGPAHAQVVVAPVPLLVGGARGIIGSVEDQGDG